MNKNLFLYLFILSTVGCIFLYITQQNQAKNYQKTQTSLQQQLKQKNDSINLLKDQNYFSIDANQDAQEYFYQNNIPYPQILQTINNDLIDLNTNPKGNPLIPYDPVTGKNFYINKAKILNHRWIIAEFSDGKIWGELLIKYFVSPNKPTEFETSETVIFQNTMP